MNEPLEELRRFGGDVARFGVAYVVEVEGRPAAKRGKLSGKKEVYRTDDGGYHITLASQEEPPSGDALLEPFVRDGEIVRDFDLDTVIERVRVDVDRTGFPGIDEETV